MWELLGTLAWILFWIVVSFLSVAAIYSAVVQPDVAKAAIEVSINLVIMLVVGGSLYKAAKWCRRKESDSNPG